MTKLKLNVVVPVYNEKDVVVSFIERFDELVQTTQATFSLILVNDGSTDSTGELVDSYLSSTSVSSKEISCNGYAFSIDECDRGKFSENYEVFLVELSRNYGHQIAVWAGLESSSPLAHTIVLDCDLQDDPLLIGEIVTEFNKGVETVFMQRESRIDGFFKRITANVFYWLLNQISDVELIRDSGDFYGMSPRVKSALLQHKERVKYIRGIIQSVGFSRSILKYQRRQRLAGKTHYSLSQMIRLALGGVTGFSVTPLIVFFYLGAFVSSFVAIGLIFMSVTYFLGLTYIEIGVFASLISLVLNAILMASVSIILLYFVRVVLETKARPLYFINSIRHYRRKVR